MNKWNMLVVNEKLSQSMCLAPTPEKIKEYELYKKHFNELYKEIERLNNIINKFENGLKRRIKAYEDRQALGKGYELTNVMEIQLTIDRKYLKELQELKGDDK